MQQSSFIIKVSDILLHSWSQDTVSFVETFSTRLPKLIEWKGIECDLLIEHLNKEELLLTLEECIWYFESSCDRCWKLFEEERILEWVVWKWKIWWSKDQEDCISIDAKNLTIDCEDFIVDQLNLNEPLKKLCKTCLQNNKEESSEDEYKNDDVYTTIKREKE